MDQAKAIINLNEGIIQLEGPMEFVQRYLERYAPAMKGLSTPEPEDGTPGQKLAGRSRPKGVRRSCTRAIRAEIKAGFFNKPRSTQAVRERLVERGAVCSIGTLRNSLKKAVEEERLGTTGRGRGLVYSRKAEEGSPEVPSQTSEGSS